MLFLSDILDASGKSIDQRYWHRWDPEETWSTVIFGRENPPNCDLRFWMTGLAAVAPCGRVQDHLGKFTHQGHKIWEWRYDESEMKLYHLKGLLMDVYTPSAAPCYTCCPNCWTRTQVNLPNTAQGQICLVKKTAPHSAVMNMICHVNGPPEPRHPMIFGEVLVKWESIRIWENLTWTGDDSWLVEAIVEEYASP